MSFREDVFAKIVTYITITILLGAMLAEAFVIYTERKDRIEAESRLAAAQEDIQNLSGENHTLIKEKTALEAQRDSYKELVILIDNELCQTLREDLAARPDLIPEEAVEASLLAERADTLDESDEEISSLTADYSFPGPDRKDWLLPLNLGNTPSTEYLYYARAEDNGLSRCIDLLYQVSTDQEGAPETDEDGSILWKCIAYDAGLGWQTYEK